MDLRPYGGDTPVPVHGYLVSSVLRRDEERVGTRTRDTTLPLWDPTPTPCATDEGSQTHGSGLGDGVTAYLKGRYLVPPDFPDPRVDGGHLSVGLSYLEGPGSRCKRVHVLEVPPKERPRHSVL